MKKRIIALIVCLILCLSCVGVSATESWLWPTGAAYGYDSITSSYGYRTYNNRNHNGIDCGAPEGTAVMASRSGMVTASSYDGSRGNYIIIDHEDGYETIYMHLSQKKVSAGERVTRGQTIGLVGRTGSASGAHLHFEIKLNGKYYNPNPADYPIKGSVVNGKRGEIVYSFDSHFVSDGITNPHQILQKGSKGTGVMELQHSLNQLLGTTVTVDGKYGNQTLQAVKQFQLTQGLVPDGIAGTKTNHAINRELLVLGYADTIVTLQIGVPTMTVNGKTREIDQGTAPIKQNNRTLVPIRSVVEAFDGQVDWDETQQKATVVRNGVRIELWIGSKSATVNEKTVLLDVAPLVINDRTFLPLRFVAENLGLRVFWEEKTQMVTIQGNK